MSEQQYGKKKPSIPQRIIDDVKKDFTWMKDKLSGHVRRAEDTQ